MSEAAQSTGIPWVLHVDLDQFIAAVEVLRRPELAGLPVIVGGRGDPTERAVVSTASYEARAFGVGSGMPLRIAARKVPDAVILPVDAPAYTETSEEVMATLRAQPGVFRLTSDNWLEVMGDKPTRALWGVGPKVSKRLEGLGIRTVAELAVADEAALQGEFGPKMGPWYRQLGRGDGSATVDDTPWVARGHGRETTFQQDIVDPADIERAARELAAQVLDDVAKEGRPVVGVGLKIRYAPFITKTLVHKIASTSDPEVVVAEILRLVARIQPDRPLRLLGVRAEMAMPDDARDGHTPTRSGW